MSLQNSFLIELNWDELEWTDQILSSSFQKITWVSTSQFDDTASLLVVKGSLLDCRFNGRKFMLRVGRSAAKGLVVPSKLLMHVAISQTGKGFCSQLLIFFCIMLSRSFVDSANWFFFYVKSAFMTTPSPWPILCSLAGFFFHWYHIGSNFLYFNHLILSCIISASWRRRLHRGFSILLFTLFFISWWIGLS